MCIRDRLCYNGLGFEDMAGQQVRPDTGEPVCLAGDGTVNYHSLRWCCTWKEHCDLQVFELPGCDHRGVSTDPRMLDLLRCELGLEFHPRKALSRKEKALALAARATKRWGTTCQRLHSFRVCAMVSKTGFAWMNTYRSKFSIWVKALAFVSVALCVFVMVFAYSLDYKLIRWFSWATAIAEIQPEYQAWLGRETVIDIDLGVLSFAYDGIGSTTETDFFAKVDLQIYRGDTTCSTLTRRLCLGVDHVRFPGP
eukprot:TRINITY_DN37392_c0_g1_i1.p1 TRINITY_DN37392_c0_g1~~TRINITY_DN37392_c0_g1_i1.p1  ORF type:complete len:253 (-),score=38.80 TRINITY_DN37392_c0_g1_i1:259-1017(-)